VLCVHHTGLLLRVGWRYAFCMGACISVG
jgi:hypothetical protein